MRQAYDYWQDQPGNLLSLFLNLLQLKNKENKAKPKISRVPQWILVCSYIDYSIYKKCQSVNVKGIICGGFDYDNLSNILGYPLGVAITGTEDVLTLVITEGFGEINMAKRTFGLLLENNGKNVSINGATQIRAGVMRPEIFI